MCRFALYLGPPITLAALVTEPVNSIIHQSFHSHERSEPLNGDGFGVAWYAPEVAQEPAVFRSVTPAWNNQNLFRIARATRSECILAHVRAASPGLPVTETNCHPFAHGPLAFMHNGGLAGFRRVKRALLATLSDEAFAMPQGSTDSEALFALFLDEYRAAIELSAAERMARALESTIRKAVDLTWRAGVREPSYLNLAVSDGKRAVVSRFTSGDPELAPSLYLHIGKRYVCEGGCCRMVSPDDAGGAVLICSEPLSRDPGWVPVPPGSLVVVHEDRTVDVRPCGLAYAGAATRQKQVER